jgi:hypothetical protein
MKPGNTSMAPIAGTIVGSRHVPFISCARILLAVVSMLAYEHAGGRDGIKKRGGRQVSNLARSVRRDRIPTQLAGYPAEFTPSLIERWRFRLG